MQRHNNSIAKINILLATFACSGNLPAQDLIISEIWPGQEGTDVTADWFEIRNDGMAAWVSGIDANLYYDDDSSAPTNADIINGITNIQPGESVIVVVGDAVDATEFTSVWSPVIDLSATEVGWTDGSGLGGGGDAVTLWIGDPNLTGVSVEDFASYPDTSDDDAASYNILSSSFSSVGSNGAVSSIVVGGTTGDIPAVASPGDGSAIFESNLQITEIWPGQDGDDITEDWFEIKNTGNAPYLANADGSLYYDDISADINEAVVISNISSILPGESVIVVIGLQADADAFETAWSDVIDIENVQIGWADGAGLGGTTDAVTLWTGDPTDGGSLTDSEVYLDADLNNAASFDVVNAIYSLDGTEGAVTTTTLGGNLADTPAVGSPGDGGSVSSTPGLLSQLVLPEGAEIAAFDDANEVAYVTSGAGLQVVDLSDPSNPIFTQLIEPASLGLADVTTNDITSVAVGSGPTEGFIAIAVPAATVTDNGCAVILSNTGNALGCIEVGALPDMLTFTPDGNYLLVANEGQSAGGDNEPLVLPNPEGSVTLINFINGLISPTVTTAGFSNFDAAQSLSDAGVRVFDAFINSASIDFEPEYIAVSEDNSTAYVALQENNAVAVLDIQTATFTSILPLGQKDHSAAGNGLDASDRDSGINIQNWDIRGLYMPDAIATYTVDGETYFVTANEGDSREVDEARGEDLVDGDLSNGEVDANIDPTLIAALNDETALGRLQFSTVDGDIDDDGDIDVLHSFGARSFSIYDSSGNQVFDSGDSFEQITAQLVPSLFNSEDNDPDEFDGRSDNKGPEPEGIAIGELNGVTYAFIGLERVGGIMIYDISNPAAPVFIEYRTVPGDQAPEGVAFVDPEDSPTGTALILVTNEESNTLTTLEFKPSFTLTVLHNNDGESSIFPDTDVTLGTSPDDEFGGAATFVTLVDQEKAAASTPIMLSSGDNFLPGTVVDAGIAASVPFNPVVDYNANLINEIGYDTLAIGNHDFDLGPDFLADFIEVTNDVPFLSSNIDFSPEASLQALVDSGRIAKSTIIQAEDEQVGVIGAITEGLASITNEGDVIISAVEAAVEAEVASLQSQGINKIILVSHLQGISEELALIGSISGIDVVIAGGGDEILDSGDTSNLLPSDTGNVFDTYPIVIQDELNEDVYVVTTPGNYRYLGRLEIDFDAEGKVISVGDNSELVRNARVDGLVQDPNTLTNVVEPVEDFIANAVVIAESQVELDTSRPNIRVIQTNIGSISADAFKAAAEAKANTLGLSDDYIIALTNGGGIRTDRLYPSGDLTDQTLANIFPFGNTVNAITGMTTAQLLSVLEHSVAAVEGVSGQWGQISGFTFSYDPTQQGQTTVETSADSGVFEIDTPGGRILDVYLEDGTQIISDGGITAEASSLTYTFVTNDFILDNGDRYPLGTFSGDTYTPFTNVVIEDFGDVNGSGSITYADVAQWYITNLANIADTSLPDITTSHYGPAAVVNRVVAIDPVLGSDLDGDGINDEWEQLIIGFAGNDLIDGIDDVNATTDFDDDGILDIDEFTNGTDPTVETETVVTFPIVASGFIGNDFFIDVEDGVFGKKVTSSDDLVLPFTDISNISIVVDDNNEFNRFIIPASELNSDKDFFRVEESEIILLLP